MNQPTETPMNITVLRTAKPAHLVAYTPATVQLARKLETAATGKFPHRPMAVYLSQAQFLTDNPMLTHSIMASLVEVTK